MATTHHPLNVARATDALWKFRLRRSVRLILALKERGVEPAEIHARLRLVERQLLLQLVRAKPGQRPLVTSPIRARAIVEIAQVTLLSSAAMAEAIRAEISAHKAIHPVKDSARKQVL